MKKFVLVCLSSSILFGCGSDPATTTYSFDAPVMADIVDAAVPASLKASAVSFARLGAQSSVGISACGGGSSATCNVAADFISFLTAGVFEKSTEENVAATQYYRYWVDKVDEAMAETKTRVAGSTEAPPCLSTDPVSVDFEFNINAEAVKVTQKLQCWEEQSANQDMAFGKDGDDYYLVYRTNDNLEEAGKGVRFVIAQSDGTSVQVWFVGASYQTISSTLTLVGNAQRVMANKDTGDFVFNTVESLSQAKSMVLSSLFARTDGTNVYLEAAYGDGTNMVDVTGMTRAAPYCATVEALTTALAASTCATINSSNMPTGFGLTFPMTNSTTGSAVLWQADTTAEAAFGTALDAIADIDYTALGVTKFGP